MPSAARSTALLDEWIGREALPFSLDSRESSDAAVDRLVVTLGESVELLGFGEALHGGEEILLLRNRLFRRLVEAHGYATISLESCFAKARLVDEYVAGRGSATYDALEEAGFGHGCGKLEANRELVEWMRAYNADPDHPMKLRFDAFDIATAPTGIGGPRQLLEFSLDYLASIDGASGGEFRRRIEACWFTDADWENPAVYADPSKSVGLTPAAAELRIATEDFMTELRTRRPELVAAGDSARFDEALQFLVNVRQLLCFHAGMAGNAGHAVLLGIRDALMADNLKYLVERERGRGGGKVLVFAHNAHLQRGRMASWPTWQKALGKPAFSWWPAGAHLDAALGRRYAVIGSALGVSDDNGIPEPEPGTLEARLTATSDTARFLPTHPARSLPATEIAATATRPGSTRNLSYIPLSPQSFTDFDAWAVLNTCTYSRGGRPLPPPADDGPQS